MIAPGIQATTTSFFIRRCVTITLYTLHFLTAKNRCQAMNAEWSTTVPPAQYIAAKPTRWNIQTWSRSVWWAVNKSTVAVNGMDKAPTSTSATAILRSSTVDTLCSRFFLLTAMISKTFRRTMKGEEKTVMPNTAQGMVFSSNSQVKLGRCKQKNSDLGVYALPVTVSDSFTFILPDEVTHLIKLLFRFEKQRKRSFLLLFSRSFSAEVWFICAHLDLWSFFSFDERKILPRTRKIWGLYKEKAGVRCSEQFFPQQMLNGTILCE